MNTDKQGFMNYLKEHTVIGKSLRTWIRPRKISVSICVYLWLILCVSVSLRSDVSAQVRPVYDRGAMGLGQVLKRLNTTASVLMIGAHPDDEDTALLAYLARGENARTAYLSLTRGDGGQNIIGPELGEALGVIRTEELLQARRLDGAEQFFTRAYDYGFSKTLSEAKEKWDEKIVLCDAVRVIREFRPLVVVSQFSGTPADGHGQHQFAGYIAPLAVKAAADASQCSDAGPVWQVKKFYVRHRGQGEPTLRINTGKYDPLLGRSYFEIAMEARSQHRSQDQGVLELKGDQFSGLDLVNGEKVEENIFDGIDNSVKNIPGLTGNSETRFVELASMLKTAISNARSELDVNAPAKILPMLIEGYKLATEAQSATRIPASKAFMGRKLYELAEAIKLAAGIQIDAIADRETVVAGETTSVGVRAFFAEKKNIKAQSVQLIAPENWAVSNTEPPQTSQQGFFRRETGDHAAYFSVTVPVNARPSQPYWLIDLRDGDLFRWYGEPQTKPFQQSMPRAEVKVEVLGTAVVFDVPVEYRYANDTLGEIRRNVDVVPAITVDLDQSLLVIPYSDKPQTRRLVMNLTSHSTKPVSGIASLNLESEMTWKFAPASKPFELTRKGEKLSIP
ncbi:MAG: PIG-L family deacetylase, partial [Pyrinomonadaceae bacterium]